LYAYFQKTCEHFYKTLWLSFPTAARSLPVPGIQLTSMIAKALWFNCRQRQQILITFTVSRPLLGPRSPACWALNPRFTLTTAIYVLLVCPETHVPLPLLCKIFSLCIRSNTVSVLPYSPHTHAHTHTHTDERSMPVFILPSPVSSMATE